MSGAENLSLDTNVLVYAHDRTELVKGPIAQALLARLVVAGQPLLSVQVLSEFYWTVTRKIPLPLSHDEAVAEVSRLLTVMRVMPLTRETLERAFQAITTHRMPLWDAQIFATAALHGASIILSEDFQHRRTIDGITFLNPFAADFDVAQILTP